MKNLDDMAASSKVATELLRAMSHPSRLAILNMLADGEKTVDELGRHLGIRQGTVLQHLVRLRADRLVRGQRAGNSIRYSLASREARVVIETLCALYCGTETK